MQESRNWYNCTNEQPSRSGKYLVTHDVYNKRRVDTAQFEHSSGTWFIYHTGDIIHPVAWMPLPDAYNGESTHTI